MNKKYIFWFFCFGLFFILYKDVLFTYFTQDDFFHFKIMQTDGSLKELLYLIGFHPFSERGIAFYRPIFRDLLYHFSYLLFGLDHFPLRLLSIILHLFDGYLIYLLIKRVFKNRFQAYISAFYYVVSTSNVATLYYLAGGIQVLGGLMFVLTSLLLYLKYLDSNNNRYLFVTYLTSILSLASHEQCYILPFLLLFLTFMYSKKNVLKRKLIKLTPLFIIFAVYLFSNYFIIGFSRDEIQYQTYLSPKRTLNSLIWYTGWAFGLPEMLQDFMPSLISIDERLMYFWGNYYKIIFPSFFISLIITIFLVAKICTKKIQKLFNNRLYLLIFWYIASLLPVIFLPFHKSGHYLGIGLPAFWGIISYLISKYLEIHRKNKSYKSIIIVTVLIVSLSMLSSTSAVLGKNFYWAAERGRQAEKMIMQIKTRYPSLPKGATLFVKNDPNYPFVAEDWGGTSKQAYFILNNKDALQLIYKDPTLNVIYEDNTDISINTKDQSQMYEIIIYIK